jgi:Lsr2
MPRQAKVKAPVPIDTLIEEHYQDFSTWLLKETGWNVPPEHLQLAQFKYPHFQKAPGNTAPGKPRKAPAPASLSAAATGESSAAATPAPAPLAAVPEPKPVKPQETGNGVVAESGKIDPKEIRAWAQKNGIDAPRRGRVPASLIEQWTAAQAKRKPGRPKKNVAAAAGGRALATPVSAPF